MAEERPRGEKRNEDWRQSGLTGRRERASVPRAKRMPEPATAACLSNAGAGIRRIRSAEGSTGEPAGDHDMPRVDGGKQRRKR